MHPKYPPGFDILNFGSSKINILVDFNQNKKTDELHDACDKAIWMIVEKNYSKSYVCKSLSKKNKLVSQNGLKSALNDILPDYVKKISYGVQQAKFFRKLEKCS